MACVVPCIIVSISDKKSVKFFLYEVAICFKPLRMPIEGFSGVVGTLKIFKLFFYLHRLSL